MTDTNEKPSTPAEPVSWDAPDKGIWSLETAHSTTATSVPGRQLLEQGFTQGFRATFAELGVPLSHIELHHINGWPYVSVFLHDVPRSAGKPPPDVVLKVLTRLHPGFRKRTKIAAKALAESRALGLSAAWEAERQSWIDRILDLQQTDLHPLDDVELAAHLARVNEACGDGLRRHFELVAGCIPLGAWLARSAEWGLQQADARRAVMHSTPVHEEARTRLARVAAALGDATPSDLDGVRAHSEEAAEALDEYVSNHGWWATEDAIDADRLIDHPGIVLNAILSGRSEESGSHDAAALLDDLRQQVAESQRAEFDQMAAEAHRSHRMLDDNSGILASWLGGITGEVYREAARRLVANAQLHEVVDIWAFTCDQILELLEGRSPLTDNDIAAVISKWEMECGLTAPEHLNGEPTPPPDPAVFPAPVAQLMTAIGAFLNDKFNDEHETQGIGDRPVTGRAVVVRSPSDAFDRLEPGDILVTTATTPSYNAVLPIVAGLVVSEGGLSCHAAIVARELDLPTIVGMQDALGIPDGATITLDPVGARVSVL